MPQFLISTMNSKFDPDRSRLNAAQCVVINQVEECRLTDAEIWAASLRSKGGLAINVVERGLSRSRNKAIAAAKADICVIADDDLMFDGDADARIEALFAENPNVDVITFQARDGGGRPLKRYRKSGHAHSLLTAFNIISFEIAFRRTSVINSGVLFDERFGLGAKFVSGEENIFVADLVRAGLNVRYGRRMGRAPYSSAFLGDSPSPWCGSLRLRNFRDHLKIRSLL